MRRIYSLESRSLSPPHRTSYLYVQSPPEFSSCQGERISAWCPVWPGESDITTRPSHIHATEVPNRSNVRDVRALMPVLRRILPIALSRSVSSMLVFTNVSSRNLPIVIQARCVLRVGGCVSTLPHDTWSDCSLCVTWFDT